MSADPVDMIDVLDRLLAPIQGRLDSMDHKLDEVVRVSERMAAHEKAGEALEGRVKTLENGAGVANSELAYVRGRNSVIVWLLGLVGAPCAVALILAGVAALFGIQL